MGRFGVALVLWLLTALVQADLAQAGSGCCICSGCGRFAQCTAPPISCDITCTQLGCTGFMLGDSAECSTLPPCQRERTTTTPAPAVGGIAIALIAAGLGGFGLMRLARRRA